MTYSKVEAHTKIIKLVEDFRAHEATLEKAAEAQIENNFIRPLFRYLNWNTENEGLSHAHYEFKVQVTNRKGLRPDYILNLDGRDVLVMDAKQVKYSMKDPRWLYQVYSYAYSTQNSKPSEKIDFAILTDFQEFIVLDCTLFAAKPEAVNNFRVIDWKYTDYVDKFDELWELFERNHVMEDSRRGELHGRPEGKDGGKPRPNNGLWSRYLSPQKVKANRIPPDKAFLAEMDDEKDGWRVLLAKDMKKLNPSADGDLITAAVQLLIDRLIFIKALSDREVDRDYLSEIKDRVTEAGLGAAQRDAGWFSSCKTIFEELNNFYNGSIFAPRPELENVFVSNKVVQAVITDLQPENSPYNFAVLPVEILGTIYERFLGRVVRTTEKQVKIEEKPEVRKAGGVYYTPQYIVDYIVENTLGSLLKDPSPGPSPDGRAPSGEGKRLTPADVAKIKVLDPSCGSGSFLLGAYGKLIEWHKDYFARAGKEKRDRESFYRDESGQIRLTAKLKRDILKNNLFGVDIDPQAVEVTRFSLSLKALEDLREGELTEERTLFHQTVLPDLSQNIKNGNSLIGNDYFAGQMFPNIEEMKQTRAFDWKSEFPEIMNAGGFDAIIGNPPYISVESTVKDITEYYLKTYSAAVGRANTFALFIEKSLAILRDQGKCGLIVSNRLLTNAQLSGLRKMLLEQTAINNILAFKKAVFGAAVDTSIFILTKESNPQKNVVEIWSDIVDLQNNEYITNKVSQSTFLKNDSYLLNVKQNEEFGGLISTIRNNAVDLDVVCDVKDGIILGEIKDLLLSDKKQDGRYEKWLEGNEVSRYSIEWTGRFICYDKSLVDEELKRKQQKAKQSAKSHSDFEKLSRSGVWLRNPEVYRQEKILTRQNAKKLIGVLDEGNNYFVKNSLHSTTVIDKSYNLKYILGLINSRLLDFYFQNNIGSTGEIFSQMKIAYIKKLPIHPIDFNNPTETSQHEKMVALVSQMLELHKSKAGAKTQAEMDVYERQIKSVDGAIDGLVYELYGLTEEEVKIVEG
ncbi:MAG: N-6 DNA methylase [Anaerolineales bacterium]|nr:N-6 DNA methylase [Anaerolineales bacterium]